jgi:ResB protein required for cytochrome c biosynthesis
MRSAVVMILCLAVLAVIGTLVIQAPTGVATDRQAYAAWLEAIGPRYGGWTVILDQLQLFSVFSSIWFKAIVVGLTTSIMACSVNRLRRLWRTAIHPRTKMISTFYDRAPYSASVETPVAADAALEDLRRIFNGHHFRIVVEREGDDIHVYAERFRWAPFGSLMAHLSLVLILVGALVGSTWGFRNPQLAVSVGSRVDVGNGTGLKVEARSFADSYYADGRPSDFASDLVVYRDGVPVADQTVRVNQPLRYGGITFYQSYFGPAAVMQVADASGGVVFEDGVPLEWASTDGRHVIGRIALPDAGLTVYVIGVASGESDPQVRPGQMRLALYQTGSGGGPIATQVVSQGRAVRIVGLDFTFLRERQFTGLIVARDPGLPLVWGGAAILLCGMFLVLFFQNRRTWALIRRVPGGSEVLVGATSRHDSTFGADFQRLVDEIKLALAGPSAS